MSQALPASHLGSVDDKAMSETHPKMHHMHPSPKHLSESRERPSYTQVSILMRILTV